MVTREQVAGLLNEEVDLGLARPPFDEEAFGSRLLHREAMLVAAPVGHRLLGLGRPVEAADLASEPVVMHSPPRRGTSTTWSWAWSRRRRRTPCTP